MKIYIYFNLLFITMEMILKNKDVNILHKDYKNYKVNKLKFKYINDLLIRLFKNTESLLILIKL